MPGLGRGRGQDHLVSTPPKSQLYSKHHHAGKGRGGAEVWNNSRLFEAIGGDLLHVNRQLLQLLLRQQVQFLGQGCTEQLQLGILFLLLHSPVKLHLFLTKLQLPQPPLILPLLDVHLPLLVCAQPFQFIQLLAQLELCLPLLLPVCLLLFICSLLPFQPLLVHSLLLLNCELLPLQLLLLPHAEQQLALLIVSDLLLLQPCSIHDVTAALQLICLLPFTLQLQFFTLLCNAQALRLVGLPDVDVLITLQLQQLQNNHVCLAVMPVIQVCGVDHADPLLYFDAVGCQAPQVHN
mmetsp:Transcript_16901/g.30226  ORF Transcript_16901/g.30226 Transcript_16901/m.30226 type:complete len:293 (+) Transcript_16901:886-1764(+)